MIAGAAGDQDRLGQAVIARVLEESSPAVAKRKDRIEKLEGLAQQVMNGPIQLGEDYVDLQLIRDGKKALLVNGRDGQVIECGPGEGKAVRVSALLWLASMMNNHWAGELRNRADMEHGTPYEALSGALWQFPCRLTEDYMASQRSRSRVRAKRAMKVAEAKLSKRERLAMKMGWKWRPSWKFITLTLPGLGRPEGHLQMLQRLGRAWALLRKRKWWKEHAKGSIKGVELASTARGWHPHIHAMILGAFVDPFQLRKEWTHCVMAATAEMCGVALELDPVMSVSATQVRGGALTDVRAIRAKGPARGDHEISQDDALTECVKYITSHEDISTLDQCEMLELILTEQWPRMFELGGLCRSQRAAKAAQSPSGATLLDTSCTSDGEVELLDGALPWDAFDAWRMDLQTGMATTEPAEVQDEEKPKAPRAPSWRKLMETLDLGDFLATMIDRIVAAQRFRARQLAARYEGAIATLDGQPLLADGAFGLAV